MYRGVSLYYGMRFGLPVLLAVLMFGAGYTFGARGGVADIPPELINTTNTTPGTEDVDFSAFWKAWSALNQRFVGSTTPETDDKVWGSIEGLAASYKDPYTVFLPPVEAKAFAEEISGTFEGVGMEIGIRDGVLVVVSPIKGTPAYRGGILAGDRILEIDGTNAIKLPVEEAVKLIRGKGGTPVTLNVLHPDASEPVEITLIREAILIPSIDTKLRDDGVFVLALYNFSAPTPNLFREALREFAESGSDKLLIDLRNNPGGYLKAAVDMASWFLPVGKEVVTEDYGKNGDPQVHRSRGYDVFNDNLKLAILVNGGSASASEILAGALRDHEKAKLIGEKTFGKGSVQELVPITGQTSLKITIARWLTPNGVSISESGLTPDIEAKLSTDDVKALQAGGPDVQLEKAVEYLRSLSSATPTVVQSSDVVCTVLDGVLTCE